MYYVNILTAKVGFFDEKCKKRMVSRVPSENDKYCEFKNFLGYIYCSFWKNLYFCEVNAVKIDNTNCVIYVGECFTVEWYYEESGYSQAYEYFLTTSDIQKRKFLILVKRIADFGKIFDVTKFRNEGDNIYAFKPQSDR